MVKAVVVLSGGLDSTVLLHYVLNKECDVYAISFDYGQKHKKELQCASTTCSKFHVPHQILNLSVLSQVAPSALTRQDISVPCGHYEDVSMKSTVVPNRNMVMLSLAVAYAISIKADYLYYGAHSGDHVIYPDCRVEFIEKMRQAIKLADWHHVELIAPFASITKADIVTLGIGLGVDFSMTWSCYKGGEKACGKCGTCIERLEAFGMAGTKDLLEYEIYETDSIK